MVDMNDLKETGELVLKIFKLLLEHPDGLAWKTIAKKLDNPSPSAQGNPKSYEQEVRVLRRSCIAPINAGWLIGRRDGHLLVSDMGKEIYAHSQYPSQFMRASFRCRAGSRYVSQKAIF
jgi:hypothetical protein